MSSKNIEDIIKLREDIKKKIEKLREEADNLEKIVKIFDEIIEKQSFKPALEIAEEEKTSAEKIVRREKFFSWNGIDYAWIEIYENKIIVNISKDLKLPIEHKLANYLKRELDKYFEEDLKLSEEGKIDPKKRFVYTLDEEEGNLTQVEFIDYGDEEKRRDLLGKIRWVLRTFAKENL